MSCPWVRDNSVHVETINESDVIFGKFDIVDDYILINHILLLAKYYIYCRCHNSVPSIRGFIARARRVFNIEQHIAREKIKLLYFHFQKWEKLTNSSI